MAETNFMAKKNCEICGAEIGVIKQVQLADHTYICRDCMKKTNPYFDHMAQTLADYQAHMKQLEDGKKLYDAYFKKNKKAESFSSGHIKINEDAGLIAVFGTRGGFIIWGVTELPVVYRLADLDIHELLSETSTGSDGKKVEKFFIHLTFRSTAGMYQVKMESTKSAFSSLEKKLNKVFNGHGIIGSVKTSVQKTKDQIAFAKDLAQNIKDANLKEAMKGEGEVDEEAARKIVQNVDEAFYVDRKPLVEKADASIKAVLG